MATALQIQQLYIAYFGRPADPSGLDYWVSTNISTKDFAAAMYAQPEFLQANQSLPVSEQVNAIYLNLFGRNGDVAGLTYWTQQINTGKLTLASIANDLIFAANNSPASAADKAALDSKTATAITYTADVRETTASFLAYNPTSATPWVTGPQFTSAVAFLATATAANIPSSAAVQASVDAMTAITPPGQTFTLTTNIDAPGTGAFAASSPTGNATIYGIVHTGATLTAADNIIATGLNNRIDLVSATDANVSAVNASITGVQSAFVTASGAITFDGTGTQKWTGLTALTTNSNDEGAQTITTNAGTAISSIVTSADNTSTVNILGGKSVNLSVTGQNAASGATSGAITIGSAAVPALGPVVISASQTGIGRLTSGQTNTQGAINVTGGSSVSITTSATNAVNTTVVQSAVTVTGSSATTTVAVTQDATKTGAATVVGKTAGAVTINDLNEASTTKAGTINNISIQNAGAIVIDSGALQTLSLGGTLTTVGVTLGALNTPTVSTLALNLNSATSSGAVTIDNDIKTLNITSSGTGSILSSLVAAGATSINVSGAALLTLTAQTINAATNVISTNTAGVSFGTALATGTSFTGGDGSDIVSFGASTRANNMGAGNDIAIVSVSALGTGGSINGGSGINTLVLSNTNAGTASGSAVFKAAVTNFSTLDITDLATSTISLNNLGTINRIIATTAAVDQTFAGVASGNTFRFNNSGAGTTSVTTNNLSATNDVLNFELAGDLSAGVKVFGDLVIPGVETVNILMVDTNTTFATSLATATITNVNAQGINISGNNGLALTHAGTALNTFNAGALTKGGVTFTSGALTTNVNVVGSASGNDTLNFASALGTATITVVGGTNTLTGSSANSNSITGGTGNDVIVGGAVADVLIGGSGADTITGGAGNDVLTGGAGSDVFNFATTLVSGTLGTVAAVVASVGTDTITEFVVVDDQFQLDQTVFGLIGGGTTLNVNNFAIVAGTAAAIAASGLNATNGGIVYDSTNKNVFFVDNNATFTSGVTTLATLVTAGDATIIANLTTLTGTLAATDFNIVA